MIYLIGQRLIKFKIEDENSSQCAHRQLTLTKSIDFLFIKFSNSHAYSFEILLHKSMIYTAKYSNIELTGDYLGTWGLGLRSDNCRVYYLVLRFW